MIKNCCRIRKQSLLFLILENKITEVFCDKLIDYYKSNIGKIPTPKIKENFGTKKVDGVDTFKCFDCNKDLNYMIKLFHL